jgi:hypothetical protein
MIIPFIYQPSGTAGCFRKRRVRLPRVLAVLGNRWEVRSHQLASTKGEMELNIGKYKRKGNNSVSIVGN